jgi:hypothetical protein
MTGKRKPLTRKAAKEGTLMMAGLGALLSGVTSITSWHGWPWTGVRVGVFVLFVVYGLAWLEAVRKDRAHR